MDAKLKEFEGKLCAAHAADMKEAKVEKEVKHAGAAFKSIMYCLMIKKFISIDSKIKGHIDIDKLNGTGGLNWDEIASMIDAGVAEMKREIADYERTTAREL